MSDPLGDTISDLSVVQSMGSDAMVVAAARVSYAKDTPRKVWEEDLRDGMGPEPVNEKDAKLIRYLLSHKHTSPFEHCVTTFHVSCPLFVRSQWHRHRTWAYNEISRRYTSDDIQFYQPKEWRGQDDKNRQGSSGRIHGGTPIVFADTVQKGIEAYGELLERGVAREQARMILPQNLYTRFYATASLHNIMHFVTLRSDPHAQYEIRVFSDAISQEMAKLFPVSWAAYLETRNG